MNPKVKKGLKITGDVLFWIFMAIMVVVTVFAFATKSTDVGGYTKFGKTALFEIQSESMEHSEYPDGGFNKGDLIICEVLTKEEALQCKKGDVITYLFDMNGDGQYDCYNTHRIVEEPIWHEEIENYVTYITKGDNPADETPKPVVYDIIEAKWTGKKVAGLGGFMSFLKKPYGFWPCIVLPLVILLGYEITKLVLQIREAKGTNKRKITAAEEELIKQKAIEEYLAKQEAEKSASDKTDNNK